MSNKIRGVHSQIRDVADEPDEHDCLLPRSSSESEGQWKPPSGFFWIELGMMAHDLCVVARQA